MGIGGRSFTAIMIVIAICRSVSSAVGNLLAARPRRSNIDGSAGSVEELERIIGRIRARWAQGAHFARADSGLARDELMTLVRSADMIANIKPELIRRPAPAHRAAQLAISKTSCGRPHDAWSPHHRVVAMAEHTQGEGNLRFVVTSFKRAECKVRYLYEKIHCARGECQADLFADRTSTAAMRANQLRVSFASTTYALLCALTPHQAAPYTLCGGDLRYHPSQALDDRRLGSCQRPPHQGGHGVGLRESCDLGLAARRSPHRSATSAVPSVSGPPPLNHKWPTPFHNLRDGHLD
jgi:hypothetical protein